MPILGKIDSDFKQALKERKPDAVSTLRLLLAALKNERIKKMADLTDEDAIKIIKSEIKKRKESIVEYEKGQRADLADKERQELEILNPYLPAQMDEGQIKSAIEKILAAMPDKENEGKVMGAVMSELKGQADGAQVRQIVSELLKK